jgi:hypothetical protein
MLPEGFRGFLQSLQVTVRTAPSLHTLAAEVSTSYTTKRVYILAYLSKKLLNSMNWENDSE